MYKISIGKNVDLFLKKQKGQKIILQFQEAIKVLSINPLYNNLDISLLRGYNGIYRLRIGKYRFLYEMHTEELHLFFFDAGSRGNIYKGV